MRLILDPELCDKHLYILVPGVYAFMPLSIIFAFRSESRKYKLGRFRWGGCGECVTPVLVRSLKLRTLVHSQ